MVTEEMKNNGIHCKGKGFNCSGCKYKMSCVESTYKLHTLKILPEYFNDVKIGVKTFELRRNDRDFNLNDTLLLQEFDGKNYTGRELIKSVSYILYGGNYGLDKDYCILGIR